MPRTAALLPLPSGSILIDLFVFFISASMETPLLHRLRLAVLLTLQFEYDSRRLWNRDALRCLNHLPHDPLPP